MEDEVIVIVPKKSCKMYKCAKCSYQTNRVYNVQRHMTKHYEKPPKELQHICPYAGCSFASLRWDNLNRHKQGVHREASQTIDSSLAAAGYEDVKLEEKALSDVEIELEEIVPVAISKAPAGEDGRVLKDKDDPATTDYEESHPSPVPRTHEKSFQLDRKTKIDTSKRKYVMISMESVQGGTEVDADDLISIACEDSRKSVEEYPDLYSEEKDPKLIRETIIHQPKRKFVIDSEEHVTSPEIQEAYALEDEDYLGPCDDSSQSVDDYQGNPSEEEYPELNRETNMNKPKRKYVKSKHKVYACNTCEYQTNRLCNIKRHILKHMEIPSESKDLHMRINSGCNFVTPRTDDLISLAGEDSHQPVEDFPDYSSEENDRKLVRETIIHLPKRKSVMDSENVTCPGVKEAHALEEEDDLSIACDDSQSLDDYRGHPREEESSKVNRETKTNKPKRKYVKSKRKTYACNTCDYQTNRCYNIKRHIIKHMATPSENVDLHVCIISGCNFVTPRWDNLCRHVKLVHPEAASSRSNN